MISSTFVASADKCGIYKCKTDLPTGQCGSKSGTDQITYNLRECADNTKVCPFKSLITSETTVNCVNDTALPVYPGGKCVANTDCVNGSTCVGETDKVCTITTPKQVCTTHDDCVIGKACTGADGAKTCTSQVANDSPCTESYECLNGSACWIDGATKLCKPLFSVENGSKAPAVSFNNLSDTVVVSFCKSGFSDDKGICRELTLQAASAGKACASDDECIYEYTATPVFNGEEFLQENAATTTKLAGSCECTYGNGDKQCKKANSSTTIANYITEFRDNVLVKNQGKCHTFERFNCKAVSDDKAYRADYQTMQVNALFENRFIGADTCVKNVVFPYYKNPAVNKCPKFSCKAEAGNDCGSATGKLSDQRNVVLNPCKEKNICSYNTDDFFKTDAATTEHCEVNPPPALSLPGETCKTNDDCKSVVVFDPATGQKDLKECDVPATKCKGAAIGDRCKDNDSCVAGAYCKLGKTAKENVCTSQIDNDTTECQSTFDCKNNTICLDKKCKPLYSLTLGASVDLIDKQTLPFACESGYYSPTSKRCGKKYYAKEEAARAEKGLVKCNSGSKCNYTVVYKEATATTLVEQENVTDDCLCGYNAEGQGYCPYSMHDTDTIKRFQKIQDYLKTNLSNSRHTVNRFDGYAEEKKNPYCKNFWVNTSYRNSVPCAQEILRFGACEDIDKVDPKPDPDPDPSDPSSNSKFLTVASSILGLLAIVFL